jgi:hypothetical protein
VHQLGPVVTSACNVRVRHMMLSGNVFGASRIVGVLKTLQLELLLTCRALVRTKVRVRLGQRWDQSTRGCTVWLQYRRSIQTLEEGY